jgi:hypothetical protein
MNPRTHTLLPLAAIAGLALAASAGAATVIASFTTNTPSVRPAAYDPGLDNLTAGWTQATASVATPYTFRYDISGLGIGAATELLITVDTVASAALLSPAAGNGIAVFGGANNTHWDLSDPSLSFTIVVEDAGNNDITSSLTIDLTGVAMRFGTGAAATFAGETITQSGASATQGFDLSTGQTAETFFTASRTGAVSLAQVQQLRFEIVPEPSVTLLLGFSVLPLLRRRRSA